MSGVIPAHSTFVRVVAPLTTEWSSSITADGPPPREGAVDGVIPS